MNTLIAKLSDLSDDQLRVMVAEECGWTLISELNGESIYRLGEDIALHPDRADYNRLPGYLNSLDAIHAAEMQFFDELVKAKYWLVLSDVMGNGLQVGHWPATARQRVCAFLIAKGLVTV